MASIAQQPLAADLKERGATDREAATGFFGGEPERIVHGGSGVVLCCLGQRGRLPKVGGVDLCNGPMNCQHSLLVAWWWGSVMGTITRVRSRTPGLSAAQSPAGTVSDSKKVILATADRRERIGSTDKISCFVFVPALFSHNPVGLQQPSQVVAWCDYNFSL